VNKQILFNLIFQKINVATHPTNLWIKLWRHESALLIYRGQKSHKLAPFFKAAAAKKQKFDQRKQPSSFNQQKHQLASFSSGNKPAPFIQRKLNLLPLTSGSKSASF